MTSAINILKMRKTTGNPVTGGPRNAYHEAVSPEDASAQLTFDNDGTVKENLISIGSWLNIGNAADYDLYVYSPTSGTFSAGSAATDTALNLGTDRVFIKNNTVNAAGIIEVVANYEIRNTGTSTVVASGVMTLTAEVTGGL